MGKQIETINNLYVLIGELLTQLEAERQTRNVIIMELKRINDRLFKLEKINLPEEPHHEG